MEATQNAQGIGHFSLVFLFLLFLCYGIFQLRNINISQRNVCPDMQAADGCGLIHTE